VPPRSRELAWPSWEAGKALEATLAARPLQLGQIVRSGDGEQKQEDADYENDKGYHGSVWRVLCDAGGGGGQDPGGPPDRKADGRRSEAAAKARSAVVVRDGSDVVEGSIVVPSGGHGAGSEERTEWISNTRRRLVLIADR